MRTRRVLFCRKKAYKFPTKLSAIRYKIGIFAAEYNRSGLLKKQGCIFNMFRKCERNQATLELPRKI